MNASVAISAYQNIQNHIRSDQSIGHDVISTALLKLETSLYLLSTAESSKDLSKPLENALVTIYFLQKGLDLNGGGDLAKHLFRLYEFCRLKIIARSTLGIIANKDLKKCHSYIKEIAQSWEKAKN